MDTHKGEVTGMLTRSSLYLGWLRHQVSRLCQELVYVWDGGSKHIGCGARQAWSRSQLSCAVAG